MVEQPGSRIRHRKLELPNGTAEVWLEAAGTNVIMHTVQPNGSGAANWTRCEHDSCLGEVLIGKATCFRHANTDSRNQYLNALRGGGRYLSLRGVEVIQELIDTILLSPLVADGKIDVPITFDGADISARLDFANHTFERHLTLSGAIVRQSASFRNCVLRHGLTARHTFFNSGPPSFNATKFSAEVDLSYAHADRVSIGFDDCEFTRSMRADGIEAALILKRCEFGSDLEIRGANATMILLEDCSVEGELDVAGTRCKAFRAPSLRAPAAHQIGPLDVEHDCTFSNAQFGSRVRFELRASDLHLSGSQLPGGGHVLIQRARVYLDQLSLGGALRISGVAGSTKRPAILGLQDADAGSMSFAHVDMSRCVFYGSHDLGSILIEPTVSFAVTPRWWYTKRRCIADEFAWRRHGSGSRASVWKLQGTRIATDNAPSPEDRAAVLLPVLRASQVAALYRDLRRSFEGKADEPGAADFYYGEMEMRRQSSDAGFAERSIVWLYWILSGYGLRASRALIWLLVLIAGSSVAMASNGFAEGSRPFWSGVIFALRAVIPGLRSNDKLTPTGDLIEIGLSLSGPALLALAVLALRGRVKR